MGGGTLEHCVWGGFFQILSDSEAWNVETMEEIAAYVTQQRLYQGRAYIQSDFRPDMSESQRTVWEETSAFLLAVDDQEDLTSTDRDALEAQRDRLIAHWRALPLATRWEERSVCDEVLRQVFDLLITQLSLAGSSWRTLAARTIPSDAFGYWHAPSAEYAAVRPVGPESACGADGR